MKNYKVPADIFGYTPCEPMIDEAFEASAKEKITAVFHARGLEMGECVIRRAPAQTIFCFPFEEDEAMLDECRAELIAALGTDALRCFIDCDSVMEDFGEGPNYCVEIPSPKRAWAEFGEFLETNFMISGSRRLSFAFGRKADDYEEYLELPSYTPMLIVGESGAGKSEFLHTLIAGMLYKCSPQYLKLLLIDAKATEFCGYEGVPHLITGAPITNGLDGVSALGWLITEASRRQYLFDRKRYQGEPIGSVERYNASVENESEKLPHIVVIIDELADLEYADRVEMKKRLAILLQKSNELGIYVFVATQRVSEDIISPELKKEFSVCCSFKLADEEDSVFAIGCAGAEKLLGKGDYLLHFVMENEFSRGQAAFVREKYRQSLTAYVKENYPCAQEEETLRFIKTASERREIEIIEGVELTYICALKEVVRAQSASISMIQRRCSIGYNRAGKILDWMEECGFVGAFEGAKARKVLMTEEEFEERYGKELAKKLK